MERSPFDSDDDKPKKGGISYSSYNPEANPRAYPQATETRVPLSYIMYERNTSKQSAEKAHEDEAEDDDDTDADTDKKALQTKTKSPPPPPKPAADQLIVPHLSEQHDEKPTLPADTLGELPSIETPPAEEHMPVQSPSEHTEAPQVFSGDALDAEAYARIPKPRESLDDLPSQPEFRPLTPMEAESYLTTSDAEENPPVAPTPRVHVPGPNQPPMPPNQGGRGYEQYNMPPPAQEGTGGNQPPLPPNLPPPGAGNFAASPGGLPPLPTPNLYPGGSPDLSNYNLAPGLPTVPIEQRVTVRKATRYRAERQHQQLTLEQNRQAKEIQNIPSHRERFTSARTPFAEQQVPVNKPFEAARPGVQRPESPPPLPPVEAEALLRGEQPVEKHPDEHIQQDAWRRYVVDKHGKEVVAATTHGEAYYQERQKEILPARMGDGRDGTGAAQQQGLYGVQQYSDALPRGITAPSLPQGASDYADLEHRLASSNAKKSQTSHVPGVVFWIMLAVIIAAFFAAALI